MNANKAKWARRQRRRRGGQKRIRGVPDRPRLSIYRSLNHMYAQVIDDLSGRTLVAASTRDAGITLEKTGNAQAAAAVGAALAERAKGAGVTRVVFDRGWSKYHGRVKALADAARKGGLEF